MQTTRVLSAAIILLASSWQARAQFTEFDARITTADAQVRSGPSANYYATEVIHKGDVVHVVRSEGSAWLAITPPIGSYSWVDARDVERVGNTGTVHTDGVRIWVGSKMTPPNERPSATGATVNRGTQLSIIGQPEVGTETLLPIKPPPQEVRYIEKAAIAPAQAGQQVASNQATVVPPTYTQSSALAQPSGIAGDKNPLLVEAEAAERSGNDLKAAQLYEQLAGQVSLTNHALAMQCLNRSEQLRQRSRGAAGASQSSSQLSTQTNYPQVGNNMDGRLIPAPSVTYTQPASYPNGAPGTSQYCYVADSCQTVRLQQPAAVVQTASPPPSQQANGPQWYGPGKLYRPSFAIDGKATYGLWLGTGQSPLYLSATPGVNLEASLERQVQVYGQLVYRGDLRTHYMVVLQVHQLQ